MYVLICNLNSFFEDKIKNLKRVDPPLIMNHDLFMLGISVLNSNVVANIFHEASGGPLKLLVLTAL